MIIIVAIVIVVVVNVFLVKGNDEVKLIEPVTSEPTTSSLTGIKCRGSRVSVVYTVYVYETKEREREMAADIEGWQRVAGFCLFIWRVTKLGPKRLTQSFDHHSLSFSVSLSLSANTSHFPPLPQLSIYQSIYLDLVKPVQRSIYIYFPPASRYQRKFILFCRSYIFNYTLNSIILKYSIGQLFFFSLSNVQ